MEKIKVVFQFGQKNCGKWQVIFANAVLLVDAASAS